MTIFLSFGNRPAAFDLSKPAKPAAEDGSQKIPSRPAINRYALNIS